MADSEQTTQLRSSKYGYVIVVSACVMTGVTVGTAMNGAGIFLRPITEDLGIGYATLALYLTILHTTKAIFLPFAGKLIDKIDVRFFGAGSIVLNGTSLLLMSTFTQVWQFYVIGVVLGVGMCFPTYMAGPIMVARWFKRRVGFWIGFTNTFTGVGAVVFAPIGGLLIAANGWQFTYVVYGIVVLAMGLAAAMLMRSYPADIGALRVGETVDEVQAARLNPGSTDTKIVDPGITAKRARKSIVFKLVFVFTAIISLATGGTMQYISPMAESYGFTIAIAALALSITNVGNMIGKPLLGAIADKNATVALTVGCVCGVSGSLIFLSAGMLGSWSIFLGAVIFGVSASSCILVSAMTIRFIFGNREYEELYPYLMIAVSLGAGFGATLVGFIRDFTGGFIGVFWFDFVMIIIAFCCGFSAIRLGRKYRNEWHVVGV